MPLKIICPACGLEVEKDTSDVNRAKKAGLNIYCSRLCGGIGRRKTDAEKKTVKAAYDKKIRNTPKRRQKRKEYFQKSYTNNPDKYKKIRQEKYKKHLEYLQSPRYKEWKKQYDLKYLAKKNYGVFWESALLLNELEEFLIKNAPDGIKFQMGITNKTQKRKRLWQQTQKQKN